MNKNIWLTAGIAGMLLSNPSADARGEVTVQITTVESCMISRISLFLAFSITCFIE